MKYRLKTKGAILGTIMPSKFEKIVGMYEGRYLVVAQIDFELGLCRQEGLEAKLQKYIARNYKIYPEYITYPAKSEVEFE